ncbi:MAG: hypothetical protein HN597_14695 [Desulfobacula sp.]|jgi:hypothetical protein|uniref:hypothetical protein n=1 Tax=Desulfobacula sp. TaxID=2593537 RepID=UPI0039B86D56|nr:hypothetical protein [Desulfobacula sp.]
MDRGYIRLWRKSLDGGLLKNHNVWVFWSWCLMKANHTKDKKFVVGFQEIYLQPGEFIFGRKKAAEETGLSEQKIRTCLTFLKKSKNLTIKPTNKFSIVSIANWKTYQFCDDAINQQSNQQLTSKQPASNQQVTTNKNKRTKEQKNKRRKKPFLPPTKDQVINYFIENGFDANKGSDAFEFYDCAEWYDSRGNKVNSWKQKMRSVWFKEDNKVNNNKGMTNAERWVQQRKGEQNAK